jgi:hypothetical protein
MQAVLRLQARAVSAAAHETLVIMCLSSGFLIRICGWRFRGDAFVVMHALGTMEQGRMAVTVGWCSVPGLFTCC